MISWCVQEVEGPFRCNGGVKSSLLIQKKEIIPSNTEPAKPSPKAGNRHANQDSKTNHASFLVKRIACAISFTKMEAQFVKPIFFKNWPRPSFSPHRAVIGPRRRKYRLGKHDFGCAKALHLHLWINLLFVRYFPHLFSCFFLFVHQFALN